MTISRDEELVEVGHQLYLGPLRLEGKKGVILINVGELPPYF